MQEKRIVIATIRGHRERMLEAIRYYINDVQEITFNKDRVTLKGLKAAEELRDNLYAMRTFTKNTERYLDIYRRGDV